MVARASRGVTGMGEQAVMMVFDLGLRVRYLGTGEATTLGCAHMCDQILMAGAITETRTVFCARVIPAQRDTGWVESEEDMRA